MHQSRRNIGEGPLSRLSVYHVLEPLGEKGGDIGVQASSLNKHLSVAQPAQALIALRAVGGNAEEISPLSPHDIGKKLIDQLARALKLSGKRGIRGYHLSLNRFKGGHSGIPG